MCSKTPSIVASGWLLVTIVESCKSDKPSIIIIIIVVESTCMRQAGITNREAGVVHQNLE